MEGCCTTRYKSRSCAPCIASIRCFRDLSSPNSIWPRSPPISIARSARWWCSSSKEVEEEEEEAAAAAAVEVVSPPETSSPSSPTTSPWMVISVSRYNGLVLLANITFYIPCLVPLEKVKRRYLYCICVFQF